MYSKAMTVMKRIMILIAALVAVLPAANAQRISDIAVSDLKIIKNESLLDVDMDIDLSQLDVKSRRSVHLVPVLKNGSDSTVLSPIGIYSRGRYINYLRRGESVFEDLGEKVYKEGEEPNMFNYSASVPYESWMDGADVYLNRVTAGCCQDLLGKETSLLGGFKIPVFDPYFLYIQPEVEVLKMRELSGTAYIDFVVSRTDINPDYRNNRVELGKITATIDSVKNDKDIKVKGLYLKGFASPESPYDNNERLARGRVAALKAYVEDLYSFAVTPIVTDYEPENWEGLREFVVADNTLSNKSKILAVIDSDREPDPKEYVLKSQYPDEYKYLLDTCYPALRKTDYRIEYSIEVFTDVNEIVEIFRTAPNKLSLNELYLASTAFEPGSEDFVNVFETAVRMYPIDPVANLNAANVAMMQGRYKEARNYLLKAGESDEVTYAWGLYHIGTGSYDKAEEMLKAAKEAGITQADQMLEQCAALKKYHGENK